jgi:hypothetical protein
MFRCIAAIPNSGGKCIEHFYPDTPEGHQSAEAFAQQYNRDGWGVYDCVSSLKEQRRAKNAVAEIPGLHWDIDARHVSEPKEKIIEKVREKLQALGILTRLVDSGRGVHVYTFFREPIGSDTPDADKAQEILRRVAAHLGADMAPTHFAALMRRPGTNNSKEGGGPCQVILDTQTRVDLSDIETYLDLVEGNGPLFTSPTAGNDSGQERGPVQAETELAAIKNGGDANQTQTRVITSLIWRAMHPADIAKQIIDSTMDAAQRSGLKWDRAAEEKQVNERIKSQYHSLFEKEYDTASGIPTWLPMEFHERWAAALADGRRPTVSKNGSGWHIRTYGTQEANGAEDAFTCGEGETASDPAGDAPKNDAPKTPFILRPFEPFDATQLPPREFLFGKHYQRRTVQRHGGAGRHGQIQPSHGRKHRHSDRAQSPGRRSQGASAGHNGEDNMIELQRRLAGICQHYKIPMEELRGWFFMTSGNEVPLRVAESWNQVRLNTDHRLVKCLTEAIGDNKIDVANLDPLVTLHGVRESDPGQMDSVIRIFTRLADAQNCAVDLSHHTRKLAPGSAADDYTIDDMRGARAISDAMRAVRMLNFMSPQDAENAGLMEIERTTYFRIDRAKANYSAPSKEATWRKFANVDLPNGDAVGVVTPWQFPGQDGAPTPEKLEAERKAEHVFLEILRRLSLAGRFVSERGAHNAPHVFAKEKEAKLAKIGKAALAAAMLRLFDKGKIRQEEYTKPDRHIGTRIIEM